MTTCSELTPIIPVCVTDRGEGAEVDMLAAVGVTVALIGRLHAHLVPAQVARLSFISHLSCLMPPHEQADLYKNAEPHDMLM